MTKQGEMITPTGRLVLPAGKLGSEEWMTFRRLRAEVPGKYCIGSSDVPSILDLESVGTPLHVYQAKVNDIRPEPNEAMTWGHLNEPAISLEWCRRNRAVIDEIGLVSREGAPWHQSTIDRRVRQCPVYGRESGEECLLEVKNVDAHVSMRWHKEIPDRILAQILHQLYVTGYKHAHYACLVGGNKMKQGIVYADRPDEIKLTNYLVAEVDRFRNEHLIPEIEPEWAGNKPDKMIELDNLMHPERAGVEHIDVDGIGEVMGYAALASQATELDKKKKAGAAKLRQLAGGKWVAAFSGERAYWYTEGARPKVDLDKLKERWPDAYEECVSETTFPVLHIDKAFKPRGESK